MEVAAGHDGAGRAHVRAVAALAAIADGDGEEVFFARLTAAVADLVGAERVVVWRLEEGSLRALPGAHGVDAGTLGRAACRPDGGGPLDRAVFGDEALLGSAAAGDPAPGPMPARDWALVGWRQGPAPLGLLAACDSARPGGFVEADLQALRTAALAAALVWRHREAQDRERAATEEQRRRVHELALMQDLTRTLASTLDLQAVLDELARGAARIASRPPSEPGQALVLRPDGPGGRLAVVAAAEAAGAPFEQALRRHVPYVLESGRSLHFVLDQVETEPERRHLAEAGVGSVALVPIPLGEARFGALAVGVGEARAFGPDQLRRLTLLADLSGLAIANASAYQREHRALQTSQERLRELALLHGATRTFSSTLSVDAIEREVVRTAARLVAPEGAPARRASFMRLDGEMATVVQEQGESGQRPAGRAFAVSAHPPIAAAIAERRAHGARLRDLWPGGPEPLTGTYAAFAPVYVQDEAYGIVMVTTDGDNGFDDDLLRRLEAIAGLAALAIGNARHFEAVRREGERKAALEEVKSKFLRLASHELRGPLAILRGYVSMLEDGTFAGRPEELPGVYMILAAKAGQMEMLVTQMLEAARLEEGRLRMDLRRLDLRQPVRDAFEGARLMARPSHDLRLVVPDEPVEVVADAWRVTTIVANLLDNAVKYSPDGGPVRCIVRAERGAAVVEVDDRGLGIAEADLTTLFTRFGRIVTRENSHIQGTGLGLYLSRELAHMQGGTVTAVSEAGAGSTFTLTLPLAPKAAGVPSPPEGEGQAGGDDS
jgi:signal transduction histidine kinase